MSLWIQYCLHWDKIEFQGRFIDVTNESCYILSEINNNGLIINAASICYFDCWMASAPLFSQSETKILNFIWGIF